MMRTVTGKGPLYRKEDYGESDHPMPKSPANRRPRNRRNLPASTEGKAFVRELLTPGQKIQDFVIIRHLGKGAFADVYLAQETSLDRLVALKVSRDFGEEDRTLAGLEHDSIVKVYSSERISKRSLLLINVQYIEGANLDTILGELKTLPPNTARAADVLEIVRHHCGKETFSQDILAERETFKSQSLEEAVLWIGEELALALDFAHERGTLHLDVKPANILLTAYGKPYLTDFNVSISIKGSQEEALIRMGGTWEYMAPEQRAVFESEERESLVKQVGRPADIYSLGRVLQEFLENSAINEAVRVTLERATAASPGDRFATARDLAQALRGCRQAIRVRRSLPKEDLISRTSLKHPLVALTLWGAIPQTIATGVATFYNSRVATMRLTAAQMEIFRTLNATYLPIVQAVLVMVWIWALWRIMPMLRSPDRLLSQPLLREKTRKALVKIPRYGLVISTLGWLPCIAVYPMAISCFAGTIALAPAVHLGMCFLLSWLIASSYSYLLHQKIVCHTLYLNFVEGDPNPHELAREDLSHTLGYVRFFSLLTGSIPLLAAIISLLMGNEIAGTGVTLFKLMLCSLIGGGSAGLFISIGLGQKLTGTVLGLQREDVRRSDRN